MTSTPAKHFLKSALLKGAMAGICLLSGSVLMAQSPPTQKAPSYPLITHTPYFSIWSPVDELSSASTVHWTGKEQALIGILQVDNNYYRFLGNEKKQYETILPTGVDQKVKVCYTEAQPAAGWERPAFDSKDWDSGLLPIADEDKAVQTKWNSDDIWIRREFNYNRADKENLILKLRHDDNIVAYLNGKEIYRKIGWVEQYTYLDLQKVFKTYLVQGKNVLAFHVRNTAGGRYFDVGIAKEIIRKTDKIIKKAKQTDVRIEPMRTIYAFDLGNVALEVTFTSPLLLKKIDILSRPVSYISYKVEAKDGRSHKTKVFLSASSAIAVNQPGQEVIAEAKSSTSLSMLKVGTIQQPVLQKKGDDVRIDWGYFYVGADKSRSVQSLSPDCETAITGFLSGNKKGQSKQPQLKGKQLSLNTALDLGTASSNRKAMGHMLLGYDEDFSVQYFKTNLRPWWNREGKNTFTNLMQTAETEYSSVMKQVAIADKQIQGDLFKAGGADYARLGTLAYRQSIAAHNIVQSPQHELIFLSKENFSNGSINTVDLTYPSSPLFLLYNTELLKGMMRGIFYYSESGRWKKPYAAHDLGTYPIANGQTYGEDMPIEEAGNMVILAAAITKVDGNAVFAKQHWKTLSIWADYLAKEGFDPANQLCTDDFAGHLARNVNLSAKAIMALRSYSYMAQVAGEKLTAGKFLELAKQMALKWMALADDGDHYSLSFENKGTWSQKYNLVWDKVLGFNLFPADVYQKEIAYYLKRQHRYGLPLDSRKTYTKSDWIMWSATMASDRTSFEAFMAPLCKYISETPSRVPISDWHDTNDGRQQNFQARSVVGGYFMQAFNYWLHHRDKQ